MKCCFLLIHCGYICLSDLPIHSVIIGLMAFDQVLSLNHTHQFKMYTYIIDRIYLTTINITTKGEGLDHACIYMTAISNIKPQPVLNYADLCMPTPPPPSHACIAVWVFKRNRTQERIWHRRKHELLLRQKLHSHFKIIYSI